MRKKLMPYLSTSNLLFLIVLSFANISSGFAGSKIPRARIIYGEFGTKEMSAKNEKRVKGSIRDLEIQGNSQDLGIIFACYDGATDAVCELLQIAVEEENDKNNNQGSHKLQLKCKADDFGAISTKIKSENGDSIKISKIYQCK